MIGVGQADGIDLRGVELHQMPVDFGEHDKEAEYERRHGQHKETIARVVGEHGTHHDREQAGQEL
jgi:hypothetical protein